MNVIDKETKTPVVNESATAPKTCAMPENVKLCKFYHGTIPRIEAEALVRQNGDYLLRKAENGSSLGMYLVISVRKDVGFVHAPLNQCQTTKMFYFDANLKDASIIDLIGAHCAKSVPIATKLGAAVLLKKPVTRSTWILRHDDVILYKKIGAGAFGEVFLARMVDPTSDYVLDCAVKTMKQEASMEAKLRFIKEARMMKKNYRHNHVVMIFGVATLNSPLLIIMELCPNGSLISYLRKNKGKVSLVEKFRFIYEAASGMAYLEKMNCIHRDIAARNCLLSAKNEIKISDFGLADDKGMVIDYSLDKLPIKWLAPETMQEKIYSLKSDIWAFGILVWEIFADGDEPYPGLNNVQARAKIVVQDYRMKFPDEAPPDVVQIIDTCWDKNPDKRGTMSAHSAAIQLIYEAKLPPRNSPSQTNAAPIGLSSVPSAQALQVTPQAAAPPPPPQAPPSQQDGY